MNRGNALAAPLRTELWPCRDEQHDGRRAYLPDQILDCFERRRGGPVEILDHEEYRPALGEDEEPLRQSNEESVLPVRVGEDLGWRWACLVVGLQKPIRERSKNRGAPGAERVELPPEPGGACALVFAIGQAQGMDKQVEEWAQRGRAIGRRATGFENSRALDALRQFVHQPGFPQPGLTLHEDHLPVARDGLAPVVLEQRQLVRATDVGRQADRRGHRRRRARQAEDAMRGTRTADAGARAVIDALGDVGVAQRPVRRFAHDQLRPGTRRRKPFLGGHGSGGDAGFGRAVAPDGRLRMDHDRGFDTDLVVGCRVSAAELFQDSQGGMDRCVGVALSGKRVGETGPAAPDPGDGRSFLRSAGRPPRTAPGE